MTYVAKETSIQSGQPIELYGFTRNVARFLYTTGADIVTLAGENYNPVAITRAAVTQSPEINKATIEIQMPRDTDIVDEFISGIPTFVTTLTILRYHVTDTDSQFVTIWKGRVVAVEFADDMVTLRCEPVFTSLKRVGLRATYQLLCRHVLYGPACAISPIQATDIAGSSTGAVVVVPIAAARADGFYTGGMLQAGGASRMIISHVGVNITLAAPISTLMPGDSVTILAGCDHTPTACNAKFNNLDRFGGFPYIQKKNPFTGDAIV